MKTLFLLLSLIVSVARAGELRDLLEAHSPKDLDTKARLHARLKTAHEACAAELRLHLLPRSCFEELALAPRDPQEAKQRNRLSRLCLESAKSSHSRLDLSGSMTGLPEDCRIAASERLEDLEYRDEGRGPEASGSRTSGPKIEDVSSD